MGWGDAFASGFTVDANGNITYNPSEWDKFWKGKNNAIPEDIQRYVIEYNQANKQYQDQYNLQQQEFQLNKQNLQFNQNLATRQQALAEESYYNGIRNQASQLSSLGINPAASGSSMSGGTMSGGSNVSGVPSSGRPTGRQIQTISTSQLKMQMMEKLMEYALTKRSLDIQQQNANTNSYNAVTSRLSSDADIALKNQEFRHNEEAYDAFAGLGLSYGVVRALEGVDLSTVGLTALFKVADLFLNGDEPSPKEGDIIVDMANALDKLPKSVQDSFNSYLMDNSDSKALMSVSLADCLKVIQSLDSSSTRTDIAVAFSKYM